MLEKIEYLIPDTNKGKTLFNLIQKLCINIRTEKTIKENEIILGSKDLNPKTVFKISNKVENIGLNINSDKYFNFLSRKVANSSYNVNRLDANKIAELLSEHVIRIDHTGINLPTTLYSHEEWEELLNYLSKCSNLYTYPTGEPWPFLLPAIQDENKYEISDFSIIREPRLEIVLDAYTDKITIQIDIETDMTKNEVEGLFPGNNGVYFDDLENMFKSVYVDYDEMLDIRIDIRFKAEHNDFESGKWFVEEGKRI